MASDNSKRICMQFNKNIPLHAELLDKLERLKDLAAAGSPGEVSLRILLRFIDQAFDDPAINLKADTKPKTVYREPARETPAPADDFQFDAQPIRQTSNGSGRRRGPLSLDD